MHRALRLTSAFLGTFFVIAPATHAGLVVVSYVGPDGGVWNNVANWSPGFIPNDNLGDVYEAIVDPADPRTVVMNGTIALTGLSIGDADGVTVANGVTFDYLGGILFNSGLLTINSTGVNTTLRFSAPTLQLLPVDGSGELRLSGGAAARILGNGGVRRLDNEPGHHIRGAGSIGLNTNTNLTNDGVIEADVNGATLSIDLVGATADNLNNNRIASVSGGLLTITGTALDNSFGDIVAEPGTLSVTGNSTILGGTVRSDGGTLIVGGGTTLDTVTTSGEMTINNGNAVTLRSVLVNDGDVRLQSTGVNTDLVLGNDVTVAGTGTISMSSFASNRIFSGAGERRLDLGSSQELRGSGGLGLNSGLVLTNNGTITANQPVALTVDLGGDLADNLNNGTMRATDGATLTITGSELDNSFGTIRADTLSRVLIANSTIQGGIIESLGGSLGVDFQSGSILIDGTLAASARVLNGNGLFVQGPLDNIGSLKLDSMGANTDLILATDVALTSPGELVGTGPASRVYGTGVLRRLSVSQHPTIRGALNLGANSLLNLTNDGTIVSDLPGGTLTIDLVGAAGDNINNGTIRADAGSTLTINGPGLDNTFGIIVADGGVVRLNGSSVIGGQLDSNGAGEVLVQSTATLDGVELSGLLRVPNSADLHVAGTIVNGGTISIESSGGNTELLLDTDVVVDGVGEIAMSNVAQNRIRGLGMPRRLTLAAGQVLHGSGNVGVNTNLDLTNLGSIVADGTAPLTIDVTNDFQNFGLLESLTSNITIGAGEFFNFGTVIANPGRTITRVGSYDQLGGITLVNGTLATTSTSLDGGVLAGGGTVSGPITNNFGVVSPGNPVGPLAATSPYIQGVDGVLAVAVTGPNPADIDRLVVTGAATLAGTLQVNRAGAFRPLPTDEFTILSATSRIGTFDKILTCEPVDVIYTPTEVRVRFPMATGIPGDLNGDGIINGADLGIMLGSFGICSEQCCLADLNGDGVVNGADLGILLGAWT